jgi:hypothetical protein
VPAFSVLAYDATEVQPWLHNQRGVNSWNEPKDKSFTIRGHRPGGKHLATSLLNEGFDVAYGYKPLHSGLGHAFVNSVLYLDWDRTGFPYPVVPFTVNAYGAIDSHRSGISDALKGRSLRMPMRTRLTSALAVFPDRRRDGAGFANAPGKSLDRILELVAFVFDCETWAHVSGYRIRPAIL